VRPTRSLSNSRTYSPRPTPRPGPIDRDPTGDPTGVLKEEPPWCPSLISFRHHNRSRCARAFSHIQKVLHSEGMTAVKDQTFTNSTGDAYKSLLDERPVEGAHLRPVARRLHVGIRKASARGDHAVPSSACQFGDDHLLSCRRQIFMDGSGGARTGWSMMIGSATPPPRTRAIAAIRKPTRRLSRNGPALSPERSPSRHPRRRDRAMDWVVDTYALVEQEQPRPACATASSTPTATTHALDVMAICKRIRHRLSREQPEFLCGSATSTQPATARARPAAGAVEDPPVARHPVSGGSDYFVTRSPPATASGRRLRRQTPKALSACTRSGRRKPWTSHLRSEAITAWGARQMFLGKQNRHAGGRERPISPSGMAIFTPCPPNQIKDLKC